MGRTPSRPPPQRCMDLLPHGRQLQPCRISNPVLVFLRPGLCADAQIFFLALCPLALASAGEGQQRINSFSFCQCSINRSLLW